MIEERVKSQIMSILMKQGLHGYTLEKQCDDVFHLMKSVYQSSEEETIAHRLKIQKLPFIIKDDRGNEIYHEDAKNNWCRYEYDKKNRITFCEFSNDAWYKNTYLKDRTIYENSEGTIKTSYKKS